MSLDYLSSNALNKYPFSDFASLKAVDGSFLSNDTFLDVVVASKREDLVGAFLTTYASNTSTSQFTVTFSYFSTGEVVEGSITLTIPYTSVVEKEFYGLANDDVAVKVVFGEQFVNDKATTFSHTYTVNTAKLEQSAFILMVPRVTTLTFYNWDKDLNLPSATALRSFFGDETHELDLTFEGGTNIAVAQLSTGAVLDVISGAGAGRYDGCGDDSLVIKTINDVGPDDYHNFLLVTDDCYTTTPIDTADAGSDFDGLSIENICKPKCTTEQLNSFTYYLNRITDGMQWVRDYAFTVFSEVKEQIDDYVENVLPLRNQPSYKVSFSKFATANAGVYYYSFVFGFFNPSAEVIVLDVAAYTTGNVMDKSMRYRVKNNATILSSPSVEANLECLNVGRLEFVVKGSAGTTVSLIGTLGSLDITYYVTLT